MRFKKGQIRQLQPFFKKRSNVSGHAALDCTVPFSMNLCFLSSSELQGEADPTRQMAAFEQDVIQNLTYLFVPVGRLT